MEQKAKFVQQMEHGFSGDARLYELESGVVYGTDDAGNELRATHIVVSAVNAMFSGDETYIFPANADGKVLNWGELDGSFRGDQDHGQALQNGGYVLVDEWDESATPSPKPISSSDLADAMAKQMLSAKPE